MAESIVRVPDKCDKQEFLSFSFNGKHSYADFGLIRTSEGDRYNENLAPTMNEKTAEVPGGDGMYYFGTTHKQRNFNIGFAFDHLTETRFRELKAWLNGKEMGDLWFSEAPYKVWTAKVTGNATLKYLPFEEDGQRVYKGEGSVQFVAYWPYAHTPDYVIGSEFHLKSNENLYLEEPLKGQYFYIESSTPNAHRAIAFYTNGSWKYPERKTSPILYFNEEVEITGVKSANTNVVVKIYKTTSQDLGTGTNNNRVLQSYKIHGKRPYAYNAFENSSEWLATSGLMDRIEYCGGENPGDLATPFILSKAGSTEENFTITIEDRTLTTLEACEDLEWNSKTGIVSGKITGSRRPIRYSGDSIYAIPVGGLKNYNLSGMSLNYHYWYY